MANNEFNGWILNPRQRKSTVPWSTKVPRSLEIEFDELRSALFKRDVLLTKTEFTVASIRLGLKELRRSLIKHEGENAKESEAPES